ncbi:hypothetical protein A6A25_21975 [Saccharothrix sp. CB00851]|nr:hypothetical protein A6A25_21975 [Saccharothrix sp. CB00851]
MVASGTACVVSAEFVAGGAGVVGSACAGAAIRPLANVAETASAAIPRRALPTRLDLDNVGSPVKVS